MSTLYKHIFLSNRYYWNETINRYEHLLFYGLLTTALWLIFKSLEERHDKTSCTSQNFDSLQYSAVVVVFAILGYS